MSTTLDFTHIEWVKSTRSNGNGGGCIEWSPTYTAAHGVVPVRDSKTPHGPVLTLAPTAWTDFVAFAAAGYA
ncbi:MULTISPECIES: DUF397 domain-containing protein [unclassified Streptomyces]|uniref:DUF397 domain-containing protein n=1 Tax=unclassified Streptomyces TaxID=2593676 RepID=UPI00382E2D7B